MEEGKRFSLIYLERGGPVLDSPRFRRRLFGFYLERLTAHKWEIESAIRRELGVEVRSLEGFFCKAESRDILDCITVIYKTMILSNPYGIYIT